MQHEPTHASDGAVPQQFTVPGDVPRLGHIKEFLELPDVMQEGAVESLRQIRSPP